MKMNHYAFIPESCHTSAAGAYALVYNFKLDPITVNLPVIR